jgi:hypothetical protein
MGIFVRPVESSHLGEVVDYLVRLGPLEMGRPVRRPLMQVRRRVVEDEVSIRLLLKFVSSQSQ